jgi:hypothetical protein
MSRILERSGVLVVRAWVEGAAPGSLRARITHSSDLTREQQVETTAATVEQVLAIVREWLQSLTDPKQAG